MQIQITNTPLSPPGSPTESIQLPGLPQPHGQCPHLPWAWQCNPGPEGGAGLTSGPSMISLNILCSQQFVLSHTPADPAEQSSPLKRNAGSMAPWALPHIHRSRWLAHHLGNSGLPLVEDQMPPQVSRSLLRRSETSCLPGCAGLPSIRAL